MQTCQDARAAGHVMAAREQPLGTLWRHVSKIGELQRFFFFFIALKPEVE